MEELEHSGRNFGDTEQACADAAGSWTPSVVLAAAQLHMLTVIWIGRLLLAATASTPRDCGSCTVEGLLSARLAGCFGF